LERREREQEREKEREKENRRESARARERERERERSDSPVAGMDTLGGRINGQFTTTGLTFFTEGQRPWPTRALLYIP
jgi:hypothetical protein